MILFYKLPWFVIWFQGSHSYHFHCTKCFQSFWSTILPTSASDIFQVLIKFLITPIYLSYGLPLLLVPSTVLQFPTWPAYHLPCVLYNYHIWKDFNIILYLIKPSSSYYANFPPLLFLFLTFIQLGFTSFHQCWNNTL